MKLFTAAILFVIAHSLCAADLTGRWVVAAPANNETAYYITATGNTFTGYLHQGQNDLPITDGKIDGNNITFSVTRNENKAAYTAKLDADTLTITPPTGGGRGGGRGRGPAFGFGTPNSATPAAPMEQVAHRVSTALPPPMPVPPVKQTLQPPTTPVKYNGLAKTPPMGWNSWNRFKAEVNDQVVREVADAMVQNGMRDAGYVYVNIDDTWEARATHRATSAPTKNSRT